MASWELHEMYPALDIKDIQGYPNQPPPKYEKNLPRFNGDSFSAIPDILSFIRHVSRLMKDMRNP